MKTSPSGGGIESENLADTDESPLGDTTEHAGELSPTRARPTTTPRAKGRTRPSWPPGGEDGSQNASPGEAEGAEGVPQPESERLANRERRLIA